GVGSGEEVSFGKKVRLDVVVRNRAVLVRTNQTVDPEASLRIVMAERAPEARGLDEQLVADLAFELVVLDGGLVADHGVGDVGADVERRRAGGSIPGALLAPDRPPGKCGALEAELTRALPGQVE